MNSRKLLAIAGLVALTFAGAARADEDSTGKLTLLTTLMKSSADFQTLTNESTDGLTPTTITCPNTASSCTVRLELQSQFALLNLVAGQWAGGGFAINGVGNDITPFGGGTYHRDDHLNILTVTSMKEELPPGHHVVEVRYRASLGASAQVLRRILTIQVFTVAP
jgi:hypothetical protein